MIQLNNWERARECVYKNLTVTAAGPALRAQSRAQRHWNQVALGLRCCWTRIIASEGVDGGEFIRLEEGPWSKRRKRRKRRKRSSRGMTIIPDRFNEIIWSVDTWETELTWHRHSKLHPFYSINFIVLSNKLACPSSFLLWVPFIWRRCRWRIANNRLGDVQWSRR